MVANSTFIPIGTLIDGTYRITRELGRGGMGFVYEAEGPTNRWAIKCLNPELSNVDDAVRRFQNEAKVPGLIRHRNIVQINEIKRDPDWGWYIVMPLLEGETLAERLVRAKRMDPREVCRLLLPCMRAIAKAHDVGIVHRDLKPQNIFVCQPDDPEDEEHAKVLDFGVMSVVREEMRLDSKVTAAGSLIGTRPYMCIEQLCGEAATTQFDIHAFGVILHELVAGRLPYSSRDDELDIELRFAKPISLTEHVPAIDPGFAAIVARAVTRDRRQRFGDLREMLTALRDWYARIDTVTRPRVAARGASSYRRGIALAVCSVVSVVLFSWQREPAVTKRIAAAVIQLPRPATVQAAAPPPTTTQETPNTAQTLATNAVESDPPPTMSAREQTPLRSRPTSVNRKPSAREPKAAPQISEPTAPAPSQTVGSVETETKAEQGARETTDERNTAVRRERAPRARDPMDMVTKGLWETAQP